MTSTDSLQHWRRFLTPIQEVKTSPPKWVLPGLLPPGLVLLFGDPKTYKSTLVLHMIAAVTELIPVAGNKRHVAAQKGTALLWAAEQSAGSLRHIYEMRVLKRKVPDLKEGKRSFNFSIVKNPWEWKLDEPKGEQDICALLKDLQPAVAVLDPLIHFHSLDENDPHLVEPLVPIREAALKYGGSVVVVHHARKASPGSQGGKGGAPDWSRVRGTSALWAMANGGIMTTKMGSGSVNITTEFKDYPGSTWTWKAR